MKEIDKIAWIKISEDRVLCARSIGKTKFYLPGGKRDEGESDQQSLLRECKEELDIDVIPETIEYVGTFVAQSDGKAAGIDVRLTCYSADYNGTLEAKSEIAEVKWLTYDDLEMLSAAGKLVFNFLKEKGEIG
ncbi:MAG: NUDIX domain-containing protein [Saprospiraceae bacterium]|nr:NUDIX domain-containing protein [Saprospiraceae bacterium]